MNTTYVDKVKPNFSGVGVQDVTADDSAVKAAQAGLEALGKQTQNELNALKNIAQDQAQINFNRGAAELIEKYGTDYEGLDAALMQLENESYNKLAPHYPEMATELLRQNDATRLRAREQARKNYIRDNNAKIRATSRTMLGGVEAAAKDDYLIYAGEMAKAPEERNPELIRPFLEDLAQHEAILNRLDMDGNPVYTDLEKASNKGMKGVRMSGIYELINGMTLDQLKKYYNETMQSTEYRHAMGVNEEDWEKIASKAKSRISELEKDTERAIRVRAIQETADLINNAGDMELINKVKKSGYVDSKLVDETVKFSNEMIEDRWYDPNKKKDPTGLLKLYAQLGELVSDTDESPEGTLNRVKIATKIMSETGKYQKELNLSPSDYRQFRDFIWKATRDDVFRKSAIPMVDLALNNTLGKQFPVLSTATKPIMTAIMDAPLFRATSGKTLAEMKAKTYVENRMPALARYLLDDDAISAQETYNDILYNSTKIANSWWIPEYEFDKLEAQRKEGKKPLYFHDGVVLEYNGVSDDTALFSTKI